MPQRGRKRCSILSALRGLTASGLRGAIRLRPVCVVRSVCVRSAWCDLSASGLCGAACLRPVCVVRSVCVRSVLHDPSVPVCVVRSVCVRSALQPGAMQNSKGEAFAACIVTSSCPGPVRVASSPRHLAVRRRLSHRVHDFKQPTRHRASADRSAFAGASTFACASVDKSGDRGKLYHDRGRLSRASARDLWCKRSPHVSA
jgi:hypothetical protein